ncbi:MAG: glutathione S-transferase N-terminal domain-containing protein [Polyangiaceae bacterium]|jgi:glutathione S-transferase
MATPALRLVTLHVSPWSERARWALDHHRLAYRKEEHLVYLGEGKLRRLTGKARNTVPILVADGQVLTDSWDIARYADRLGRERGASPSLFPEEHLGVIEGWAKKTDRLLQAGRGLVMRALARDPEALDESLPGPVPRAVRPLLRPVVRGVTRYFTRKYDLGGDEREAVELVTVRGVLDEMRALGLAGRTVLGSFSYADIALASALQGISPVADRHWPLRPATRRVWTREAVAKEYADLLAWRDWVYDTHRRAS